MLNRFLKRRKTRRTQRASIRRNRSGFRFEPLEDRRMLTTYHCVDPHATGSTGIDCWDNAYLRIPDALSSAAANISSGSPHDQIVWVATGVYQPGLDRTDSFQMEDEVAMYGGFSGFEDPVTFDLGTRNLIANETILDGDIDGDNTISGNSYHVVRGANDAVIDGFTIQRGNADGSLGSGNGAGMFNNGVADMTVSNMIVQHNQAVGIGAGMFNNDVDEMTVAGTIFQDNHAVHNGFSEDVIVTQSQFLENSASSGGGMFNGLSEVEIVESVFQDNSADLGGGIYNWSLIGASGDYVFIDSTFNANHADFGGGMYNDDVPVEIENGVFSGNTGQFDGGGIFNVSATVEILGEESSFTGNYAVQGDGGAVYNYDSQLSINDGTFHSNFTEQGDGGAIFNDRAVPLIGNTNSLSINGTSLSSNHADQGDGGAIYNNGLIDTEIQLASFDHNTARKGGAIFNGIAERHATQIAESTFEFNNATGQGGAIYNDALAGLDVTEMSVFDGNEAPYGGAVYARHSAPFISNVNFLNNRAEFDGGALYHVWASPEIQDSTFLANTAEQSGGGMFNTNSGAIVNDSAFDNNRAGSGGAVVNFGPYNGASQFSDVTFSDNRAEGDGGAMLNVIPDWMVEDPNIQKTGPADSRVAVVSGGVFYRNGAARGAGIANHNADPYVANSIFSQNEAPFGAAIFNDSASPDVRHSTFNANLSFAGPAMTSLNGSQAELRNSILWGDVALLLPFFPFPEIMEDSTSSTFIVTSTVQGSPFAQDPLFTNPASPAGPNNQWRDGDDGLRLQSGSPAIDSAMTLTDPLVQTDIRGVARPQLNGFDRGAYEMQNHELVVVGGPIPLSPNSPSGPGITTEVAVNSQLARQVDHGKTESAIQDHEHSSSSNSELKEGKKDSHWSDPCDFSAYGGELEEGKKDAHIGDKVDHGKTESAIQDHEHSSSSNSELKEGKKDSHIGGNMNDETPNASVEIEDGTKDGKEGVWVTHYDDDGDITDIYFVPYSSNSDDKQEADGTDEDEKQTVRTVQRNQNSISHGGVVFESLPESSPSHVSDIVLKDPLDGAASSANAAMSDLAITAMTSAPVNRQQSYQEVQNRTEKAASKIGEAIVDRTLKTDWWDMFDESAEGAFDDGDDVKISKVFQELAAGRYGHDWHEVLESLEVVRGRS